MNNDSISSVVSTLYKIKAEFPHLRIGQIMIDFHSFIDLNLGKDTFYLSARILPGCLRNIFPYLNLGAKSKWR